MAQVDFACRVLGFIKRLLNAVLPTLARDETILGTKEQFIDQIDAAFKMLDPHEATKHDYRLAVANAACGEVSNLCGILTDACECAEFGDIARRYLSPQKFVRLVLRRDTAKIAALCDVRKEYVEKAQKTLSEAGLPAVSLRLTWLLCVLQTGPITCLFHSRNDLRRT